MLYISIRFINQDGHKIFLRSSEFGLSLNPEKSAILIIGQRKTFMTYLPPIHIYNININIVESVKNVGVFLNKPLNWSVHIITNCGKTFAMLCNLWMTQYFIPTHIQMLLAKTYLLLSTIIYGSELFAGCNAVSRRGLMSLLIIWPDMYLIPKEVVAYHIMPNKFITSRLIIYGSAEYYCFCIELSIISNHSVYIRK